MQKQPSIPMTTTCTTYYQHFDFSTSGALTHRYYVQDYLGSTRAVVDEDGNVLQSTAYYPSGVPLTPNSFTPQTIKLHTGKDFFDLQGAGWYDNQARYYDCLIPSFKSIDPLAEKYPWLSPYNHCANNPLRFVDRDGMKFNENMTEEEKQAYHDIIEPLFLNSSLFKMVYDYVDSQEDVITVQYGETSKNEHGDYNPGEFRVKNKTITFLKGQGLSSSTAIEEIYHSYQNLTPSKEEDATTNFEFEAKTFTIFSCIEANRQFDISNLTEYYNYISQNLFSSENDLDISKFNNSFNSQYISFGRDFTNQYVNTKNKQYKIPVTFIPQRIVTIINKK